jgi:uncharacterized protein YkwD
MRRGPIRLLVLLVAGTLLAPAAMPAAAAPGSPSGALDYSAITAAQYRVDSQECAMLKLINDWRKRNGKSALKLSRTLGAAADHHSREMATYKYFDHTLRNGVTWTKNITNHGYPTGTYRAENIAGGNEKAAKTFQQWKNSPKHNENMLSSRYKAIGIGRSFNTKAPLVWYWTTTFGSATSQTITC